jgi:sialate O-acetylesterase
VKFKVIGSTLTLGLSPFQPEDASPMTVAHLTGFAVSGKDGKWFPAKGAIDSDTVLLSSDAVPHPVAVRYNWGGFPKGNLYNKEGLPAAPFRTDTNQPVNFSN